MPGAPPALARISRVGWVKIAQRPAWVSQAQRVREPSRGCQATGKTIEDPRGKRLARPTLKDGEKCGLARVNERETAHYRITLVFGRGFASASVSPVAPKNVQLVRRAVDGEAPERGGLRSGAGGSSLGGRISSGAGPCGTSSVGLSAASGGSSAASRGICRGSPGMGPNAGPMGTGYSRECPGGPGNGSCGGPACGPPGPYPASAGHPLLQSLPFFGQDLHSSYFGPLLVIQGTRFTSSDQSLRTTKPFFTQQPPPVVNRQHAAKATAQGNLVRMGILGSPRRSDSPATTGLDWHSRRQDPMRAASR
jgi:hypothetical protein